MNPLTFKKAIFVSVLLAVMFFGLIPPQSTLGKATRNPVLEFCTGTWCPWCPCGHRVIHEDLQPLMPNAIFLAYHGGDIFDGYPGSDVLSRLGFSAYPTGIIDRTSGIVSYYEDGWFNAMVNQLAVPATVSIDLVQRSYNPSTREFNAVIDFTALETLSGDFNYSIILVEDSLIASQSANNSCTPVPGVTYFTDYVHDHVVRKMINGSLGEALVSGTWNQDEKFRKTVSDTFEVLTPDITRENCQLVVMVYQVGSPLNTNGDIQQAEQWPLVIPGYTASFTTEETEYLGSSETPAQFTAVLKNTGVIADTFKLSLQFEGPEEWEPTFETTNGAFSVDQTDEFKLAPGASKTVTIHVNAHSKTGVGKTTLDFTSQNFSMGSLNWKYVTYSLPILIVDDEPENYENYAVNSLESTGEVNGKTFGVVSSELIPANAAELITFDKIFWMCAISDPTLDADERDALKNFLDNGGNLYLSGLDIAYQLGDPASPNYSADGADFLANYLHANYIKRDYNAFIVQGIPDDPITGELLLLGLRGGSGASTVDPNASRYANQISPADSNASPIFSFYQNPTDYAAIRAVHYGTQGTGKLVFSTFGFETLPKDSDRDLFAQNIITWMNMPVSVKANNQSGIVHSFQLHQNFPNPFNPDTRISYDLPATDGDQNLSLIIYNQLGQIVRTLVHKKQPAGNYNVSWNGRDDQGNPVSSGVYVYHLKYGDKQQARKLLLLR